MFQSLRLMVIMKVPVKKVINSVLNLSSVVAEINVANHPQFNVLCLSFINKIDSYVNTEVSKS